MSASRELEATDVVRVVLQFLQENSLTRTMQTLQDESQVALNTVESVDAFVNDVVQGNWESVMPTLKTLKLPSVLLADVYEQLVLELVELRELNTARQLLTGSEPLVRLRATDEKRYAKLETLVAKPYFDPREAYAAGSGKVHRRGQMAEALRAHVSAVPPATRRQ